MGYQAVIHTSTGGFVVTMRDKQTGMDQATLMKRGNYALTEFQGSGAHTMPVTGVRLSAASRRDPLASQKVFVYVGHGQSLNWNSYLVKIRSLDIVDIAGNRLDGECWGGFPSGNGHAGGNFLASIKPHGGHVSWPQEVIAAAHSKVKAHKSPAKAVSLANRLESSGVRAQPALASRPLLPIRIITSPMPADKAGPLEMGVIPPKTTLKKKS